MSGRIPAGRVATGDDIDGDVDETVDVVVIGSGCGGATFASELAEAGRSVLLLEKGHHRTSREFDGLELDMYHRVYAEDGTTGPDDLSSSILYGNTIGGSSIHYMANSFRAPEWKLRAWQRDHGVDLSREILDPFYAVIEERHGVHPATPEETNVNNAILRRGAEALGWRGASIPHARRDCANAGYCLLGCPFDRKQSQLLTQVPRAISFGARVLANALVASIEVEHGRAVGVRGAVLSPRNDRPRAKLAVRARVVALAAGGVGTPALLLRQGLAGSSGQVGRNFFVTPHLFVFALMEERVEGWNGLPASYAVHEWVEQRRHSRRSEGGYMIQGIFSQPGFIATLLPGFGEAHRELMERMAYGAGAISLLDDEEPGRITAGELRPKIEYHLRGKDVPKARDFFRKLSELYLAAGARKVLVPDASMTWIRSRQDLDRIDRIDFEPGRVPFVGTTNCSTCRMGADPKRSVVRMDGRTHDLRGLYIVDGSVLPTTPAVDPSLTIMANSMRVAKDVAERWSEV
ncbi:MAG: GMC family oxidoreductase [Deltaproteobacteria bacterium]|nr:GMC family oxidoreductase [Deltaproteobacteria bacterium]